MAVYLTAASFLPDPPGQFTAICREGPGYPTVWSAAMRAGLPESSLEAGSTLVDGSGNIPAESERPCETSRVV